MNKLLRMYDNIKKVSKRSGNGYLTSYSMLKKAKKDGYKYSAYISERGWEADKIAFAENNGVSRKAYFKYKAWLLDENEIKELGETLTAYAEKISDNNQWMIDVVKERTGWSQAEAKVRMDYAKTKGYNYRKFITQALYKMDFDQLVEAPEFEEPKDEYVDEEAIKAAKLRKKEYEKTMKAEMGWNDAQLKLQYLKSKIACGASFSEFFLFGLYKLPPEEGKKYITMEMHIKMQLRYIDFKGTQELFERKDLFNKRFEKYVRRYWFTNDNLTYEDFKEKIKGLEKIIYKPAEGIEGIGIEVYEVNKTEEANLEIYNQIMKNGPANIEEFFVQHHALSEFWPNSVNTIRMMTINKNGKGNVLNAVIKFGTKANVDNYYQGGIAAGIDIETGEICTDGVNNKGILFKTHPYSNKTFKGFKIPNWEKLVEACENASGEITEMPYVGWDIAISKNGEPEIIEGNHNQGAYLIQYSFAVSNAEGRRFTIDPYLWFD